MIFRFTIILLLAIPFSKVSASSCEPLWSDDINNDHRAIYDELLSLSENENTPFTITPKAVKNLLQYKDAATMLRRMEIININKWKVIISESCDKQLINDLEINNNKVLKNYNLTTEKVISLNTNGSNAGGVVSVFSKFCDVPIKMSLEIGLQANTWSSTP